KYNTITTHQRRRPCTTASDHTYHPHRRPGSTTPHHHHIELALRNKTHILLQPPASQWRHHTLRLVHHRRQPSRRTHPHTGHRTDLRHADGDRNRKLHRNGHGRGKPGADQISLALNRRRGSRAFSVDDQRHSARRNRRHSI